MNKDFSELIEYLDEKFNNIDVQLASKAEKEDVNALKSAVDTYASKADTYFQEMVMLSHKVDRHEKWLHLFAEKLGIKLEY
jgi:hypothetical protein